MIEELIILKLGGAAITDKNKPFTAKPEIIDQIMAQIRKIKDKTIILIHGAGSFAHTLAKEYNVTHGYDDAKDKIFQKFGVTKIRNSMQRLHQLILDNAEKYEILTFSLPVSANMITNGQEEEIKFFETFEKAIDNGFIPISYGDMVFDENSGFIVVSGDRIIKLLVQYFSDLQVRVIFGTDVDGLYDKDPNNEDANLIETIKLDEIEKWLSVAGESAGVDVTGGMTGKLLQINEIAPYVNRIDIINLTSPNRLIKLLNDEKLKHTKFV